MDQYVSDKDQDTELGDFVSLEGHHLLVDYDQMFYNPSLITEQNDVRTRIHQTISEHLKPREQEIIFERFGFIDGNPKTLEQLEYADDVHGEDFYPIPTFELKKRKLVEGENATLELSEEDDEFLKITKFLLSSKITKDEILVSYTGDINAFPHRYRERLLVLQGLFSHIHFVLVTKTTESTTHLNEAEYIGILKKYWGYSNFRSLKMYKGIHDPEFKKETIRISQSQILDDIVKQAIAGTVLIKGAKDLSLLPDDRINQPIQ